jgi:hypothetical protein
MTGKLLHSYPVNLKKTINNITVPFRQFADGLYMVRFNNKQTGTLATIKVLKQ